jgi:hypothetical protein
MTFPCYQVVCLVIADDSTNNFVIDTLRTVSIEFIGVPSCILPYSLMSIQTRMIMDSHTTNMQRNVCSVKPTCLIGIDGG